VAVVMPFPHSGLHAEWSMLDDEGGTHTSSVDIRFENEGYTAQGALGSDRAQFVLRLSATLIVQQFMLFRDMDEPDLWLGRDRSGRWGEINGAHRPDLDGCSDIALRMTPFASSIICKRLPLLVGHAASLNVAHVDVETLQIEPRLRTFARIGERRWRYHSEHSASEVEVDVDDYGIARDVPGEFTRLA